MELVNRIKKGQPGSQRKIFIVGDLAVDYVLTAERLEGNFNLVRPAPIVGGCAFNAAMAFKQIEGAKPIICASLGQDLPAQIILDRIRRERIVFAGNISKTAMTGFITLIYTGENNRLLIDDNTDTANKYDKKIIERALAKWRIGKEDCLLFFSYAIPRLGVKYCMELMEIFAGTGATLAVDLVPHRLYEKEDMVTQQKITLADCNRLFKNVSLLIAEYRSLCGFTGQTPILGDDGYTAPPKEEINRLCNMFLGQCFDVRYGIGEISTQVIYKKDCGVLECQKTGYEKCLKTERRGFGDILTAQTIMNLNSFLGHATVTPKMPLVFL